MLLCFLWSAKFNEVIGKICLVLKGKQKKRVNPKPLHFYWSQHAELFFIISLSVKSGNMLSLKMFKLWSVFFLSFSKFSEYLKKIDGKIRKKPFRLMSRHYLVRIKTICFVFETVVGNVMLTLWKSIQCWCGNANHLRILIIWICNKFWLTCFLG